jgi:ATP-dependent exoDNAse (exonuclease V) beta subunit
MVERLRKSPLITGAGRRFAEFPVLFRSPDDGALVEGKIDLLIEGEGGWTIVDYKTDRLDRLRDEEAVREHFEQYRPQLREYAVALKTLGVPVARACVVSARSGDVFDLL